VRRGLAVLAVILSFAGLAGCAHLQQAGPSEFELVIAHVNDTHSHLEASGYPLTINGESVRVELGGMARLKSALDDLRAANRHVIFAHGGDMVQGTLYFSKYGGMADMDILNLLGLDAATTGNHEFDRGPQTLLTLISKAGFPIVSSNIDTSADPALAGRPAPYTLIRAGGAEIGVIGMTAIETPAISNPGPYVRFKDPGASVMAAVAELRGKGVNKIIVLSHCGYEEDIAIAKKLAHVSVIVGGHTHTLLGDSSAFEPLGLKPEGPYPTVVKDRDGRDVLIVQAWEWAKVLGTLYVGYGPDGYARKWSGSSKLLVGPSFTRDNKIVTGSTRAEMIDSLRSSGVAVMYDEDAAVRKAIDGYAGPLRLMMSTVVGRISGDLRRGNNTGPGPLVADAMLSKTRNAGVSIAVQNTGGIRKDIMAGAMTVADCYELLPFNNTLVILELKGSELIAAFEQAVEFQIASGNKSPYMYVAGITFRIDETAPAGRRIRDVRIGNANEGYAPIDPAVNYKIVTCSYMAGGGDGMTVFMKSAGRRTDTGFTDAEVFMEYLKAGGRVNPPTEERILLLGHDRLRISALIRPAGQAERRYPGLLKAA
jgi:5'-nucleotidase